MKTKYCIFDKKKLCDDCGECYKCELDPNKICNNCGKCLELEGYDTKAIKIDEVLKNDDELDEYINTNENKTEDDAFYSKDEQEMLHNLEENHEIKGDSRDNIEYIEDNQELSEVLSDKKKYKNIINEVYPGLIKLNNKK